MESWHYGCSRALVAVALMLAAMFASPRRCSAQDDVLGPRFEAGAGLMGCLVDAGTPWASDYYGNGMIVGAYRLFRGLSVQGGIEYGYSIGMDENVIRYGEDTYISTDKGANLDVTWYGFRYELPLVIRGRHPLGISSVYAGAGVIHTEFSVNSGDKTVDGAPDESNRIMSYPVADATGHYAVIAARWRFEDMTSEEPGTWMDAFGVDFGVRYSRFGDCDLANTYLDLPASDITGFQVFVTGIVKFDLFY